MNFKTGIYILMILPACILASSTPNLEIIDEWKNLVFGFDSLEQEQYAQSMNYYDPIGQKRPYDGDIYVTQDGKIRKFLSIPRVSPGIPYTLAEVTDNNDDPRGPTLQAFPNTEMHLERNCDGLVSVFRIWIEQSCNRLWVIDCGRDFFPLQPGVTQLCPPKIVAFNLLTNTLEFQHEIAEEVFVREVSVFNAITLEPSTSCTQTTGFVTDARGPGLVVFKRKRNSFSSWRVVSEYFKADPRYFNTTVASESFNFIDGLYTATPSLHNQILYFHPFASLTEYVVPLFWLKLEQLWSRDHNLDFLFYAIGQRPTQSAVEVADSRGNLWFTLMDPTLGVFCWQPPKKYKAENFKLVIENSEVFQFVAGLKIRYIPGKGESIVGTSNRLQKHNTGTVNPNEINYRMFTFPIGDVKC